MKFVTAVAYHFCLNLATWITVAARKSVGVGHARRVPQPRKVTNDSSVCTSPSNPKLGVGVSARECSACEGREGGRPFLSAVLAHVRTPWNNEEALTDGPTAMLLTFCANVLIEWMEGREGGKKGGHTGNGKVVGSREVEPPCRLQETKDDEKWTR